MPTGCLLAVDQVLFGDWMVVGLILTGHQESGCHNLQLIDVLPMLGTHQSSAGLELGSAGAGLVSIRIYQTSALCR